MINLDLETVIENPEFVVEYSKWLLKNCFYTVAEALFALACITISLTSLTYVL